MRGRNATCNCYLAWILRNRIWRWPKIQYTANPNPVELTGNPCKSIPTGKKLYSLQGTPVFIAGSLFSLQGFPCISLYFPVRDCSVMMKWFIEKMLISTSCINGFMSNLIKKSWMDSRGAHLVCHRASVLCFSTLVSLLQMYPIYNVIILVISLLRSHRISHAPNSEHTWQTPFWSSLLLRGNP